MLGTTMASETRPDRRNLRAPDVLDLTEATYRQLDFWCTSYGICEDPNPGSGTSRLFTITEARVARALVLCGQHGVVLGTYARAINAALHALPTAQYLVLSADKASAHVRLDHAMAYLAQQNAPATLLPLRFAR